MTTGTGDQGTWISLITIQNRRVRTIAERQLQELFVSSLNETATSARYLYAEPVRKLFSNCRLSQEYRVCEPDCV